MNRSLAAWAAACLLAAIAHPASAQISGDAVRIGVLNDQSGPYADFGGATSVVAARMAVEEFGGQVLGKPIDVVDADHQNKPDIAAATARRWFDVEGVDVVTDLTNSAVALAVQGLAREKGRIALFSGPATTRLTGDACSPNGVHWTFDTYSQAVGTARAVLREGKDTWFLLVADYAFGHQMENDLREVIQASGGKVLGSVRHPLNSADFSSFLLQAQGSGAKVIGLANAGTDTVTVVKQANEFGIVDAGQDLVGLVVVISDVHALGLPAAKGLILTTGFYWDRTDATREWSRRFQERTGRMPGMVQAGVYSSVLHYLKAVQAAGTDEASAVMAKMRELPVQDIFAENGRIREDGRMMHDMYLVQVKAPQDSEGPWDYFRILRTIPADEAFAPLAESDCPLVKN